MYYATSLTPRFLTALMTAVFLCLFTLSTALSAPLVEGPPLGEKWFGISVDKELVGFYRQRISATPDGGYKIEGDGSVRMQVMGFSKEASSRELYLTTRNLAIKSFEVDQTIGGISSRLTGRTASSGLIVKLEKGGARGTEKLIKVRGEIIPGPMLNVLPLIKDLKAGKSLKVLTFDPEETRIKEVIISVLGDENTPDGQKAIRLKNNLYPFVDNDIWVDHKGNTLLESVREGLVVTRPDQPEKLAAFVSGMALAKKDLIYDFSMVRAEPPLKIKPSALKGLAVEIEGYGEKVPLVNAGGQQAERSAGHIVIKTGVLAPTSPANADAPEKCHLDSSPGIEADDPLVVAKSKEITSGKEGATEQSKAIVSWTSQWLKDSINDSGSAVEAMTARFGNCQSHAKLYTAIARAAGIPTRFVSGLVSQDGKGFLYHSWAESFINGRWTPVDPAFDQMPADPSHLAFFEGNSIQDLSPLLSIIGKLKIKVLDEK